MSKTSCKLLSPSFSHPLTNGSISTYLNAYICTKDDQTKYTKNGKYTHINRICTYDRPVNKIQIKIAHTEIVQCFPQCRLWYH